MVLVNPRERQSPSGRRRGAGAVGPQPAIMQQKFTQATPGILYTYASVATFAPIESGASAAALLQFLGVQQNASNNVYLELDFRLATPHSAPAPIVQLEADMDDGAGFVQVATTRQPRASVDESPGQMWTLKGRVLVPALSAGDLSARAVWLSGHAVTAITTLADPTSTDPDDGGGWTFLGQVAQY